MLYRVTDLDLNMLARVCKNEVDDGGMKKNEQ